MKRTYKILIMLSLLGFLFFPQYLNRFNFTALAEHSPDDPYQTFGRSNLIKTDCSGGAPRVKLGWGGYNSVGSWSAGGQDGYNDEQYIEITTPDTYPNGTLIPEGAYGVVGVGHSLDSSGNAIDWHHYDLWSMAETVYCPSATINITPDRYMSWNVDGDPQLCSIAACSGSSQVTYSFDASSYPSHTVSAYGASENVVGYSFSPVRNFASNFFNFVTASSGSGATCNSTPGGRCDINLNTTYCTVNVVGYWNGSGSIPTNASYSISGALNASGTNSSGTNSHTLIADSGGTSYTFNSSGLTGTINGYSSDVYSSSPAPQTCFPGSTITFNITSQSRPILDVR